MLCTEVLQLMNSAQLGGCYHGNQHIEKQAVCDHIKDNEN